ncbi:hypothetical protein O181_052755 [Austropuccinia psidii MF-1]|uniref:Transcription factor CBF/NF-Y/archaeal histone domain-containing protein n=1 Tax=Austropuccinia psidii MF-1 TaxID=1389203 RepID=A0A9Q3HSY4_9BASI|nr:hypothetical protein [Austropuccinia psidii MF-1]
MKKKGNTARFPVARIKKIMQADEDVGKVAQATPILVSKAVEMFMQELVFACVRQAQARGSRKIQAYHVKHAVDVIEAFDFLKDIVAKIPDPIQGAGSDEPEAYGSERKKRVNGKHKEDDEENEDDEDDEMVTQDEQSESKKLQLSESRAATGVLEPRLEASEAIVERREYENSYYGQ